MLDVALKEWSIVCDLLVEGRLSILLRKGGIHEFRGPGRFELEHRRFLLFPAWEHQNPEGMKEAFRGRVEVFDREPAEVTFRGWAEVNEGCIWVVPSRAAFDALDDLHVWAKPQIDMRFNYKPERPLYLVLPRVYRLATPRTIANQVSYAGCRSWVPLDEADAVDESGSEPVLNDEAFARLRERVDEVFQERGR